MVHGQSTGHFGYEKTLEQFQRRAYWDSWKTDVKLFCTCCKPCNEFHRGRLPKQAGLKPLLAGAPMEVWYLDLTGPHTCSQGYRYIMTACDSFTRFVVAVPLHNKTALSVARVLVHEVILKYGIPLKILTDLGRNEFRNELWKEMCQLLDITRLQTTAYSPSTNGKIERWHRSLHWMMAKVVDAKQKKWAWAEFLPYATVHGSTSFSLNFLLFGRQLVAPIDVAFGCPLQPSYTPNDYALHTRNTMAAAFDFVRQHGQRHAEVNKRAYDAKVKPVAFCPGDLVRFFCPKSRPGTSPKWTRFYFGPYRAVCKINDVNCVIQLSPSSRLKVVHVNKLKKHEEFCLA